MHPPTTYSLLSITSPPVWLRRVNAFAFAVHVFVAGSYAAFLAITGIAAFGSPYGCPPTTYSWPFSTPAVAAWRPTSTALAVHGNASRMPGSPLVKVAVAE